MEDSLISPSPMSSKSEEFTEVILSTGKNTVTVVSTISDVFGVGYVGVFATIFKEIFDLAEKAEHNKKVCRRLVDRIYAANKALNEEELARIEQDDALILYKTALEGCKNFVTRISKTSSFYKFFNAQQIEESYNIVSRHLDSAISQLGLQQILRTRKEIDRDLDLLRTETQSSFSAIQEALGNLFVQGVNAEVNAERNHQVLEKKIGDIHTQIDNLNNTLQTPTKRIKPGHIEDIPDAPVRGNVQKKRYISQDVAVKLIAYSAKPNDEQKTEKLKKIEKEVAILTELKDSDFILRFHGTMVRAGKLYIISEWAEKGDLNTYLKENRCIDWPTKIRIAREIASGLVFCHTFEVLHHDVRSENILLTESLRAKISNFASARKESDDTTQINDITQRYRWLAPEKLASQDYTKQCDIYSFGIVLWEIASQKIPFENLKIAQELHDAIANGERPAAVAGIPPRYEKVMHKAWDQKPIKRPTASYIVNELHSLREESA